MHGHLKLVLEVSTQNTPAPPLQVKTKYNISHWCCCAERQKIFCHASSARTTVKHAPKAWVWWFTVMRQQFGILALVLFSQIRVGWQIFRLVRFCSTRTKQGCHYGSKMGLLPEAQVSSETVSTTKPRMGLWNRKNVWRMDVAVKLCHCKRCQLKKSIC